MGAKPSDTVAVLLKREGMPDMDQYIAPRTHHKKKKSEAKAEAAAKPAQPAAAKPAEVKVEKPVEAKVEKPAETQPEPAAKPAEAEAPAAPAEAEAPAEPAPTEATPAS